MHTKISALPRQISPTAKCCLMLFYLVFCCDLLVTVSLFESHLKVPKQDGSVLWKTTSGWAFYIEMDMAWKRPWPVAAAGISGVAGVGAASMKGYGGYGQAAKCFTNRLETAKMDANLCPLLFCPNLCRSSSRLKS